MLQRNTMGSPYFWFWSLTLKWILPSQWHQWLFGILAFRNKHLLIKWQGKNRKSSDATLVVNRFIFSTTSTYTFSVYLLSFQHFDLCKLSINDNADYCWLLHWILSLNYYLFILYLMTLSWDHIIQLVFIFSVRSWSLYLFFCQRQILYNTHMYRQKTEVSLVYLLTDSTILSSTCYLYIYLCILAVFCPEGYCNFDAIFHGLLQHLQQDFDMGGGSMQLGWTVASVCMCVSVCVSLIQQ